MTMFASEPPTTENELKRRKGKKMWKRYLAAFIVLAFSGASAMACQLDYLLVDDFSAASWETRVTMTNTCAASGSGDQFQCCLGSGSQNTYNYSFMAGKMDTVYAAPYFSVILDYAHNTAGNTQAYVGLVNVTGSYDYFNSNHNGIIGIKTSSDGTGAVYCWDSGAGTGFNSGQKALLKANIPITVRFDRAAGSNTITAYVYNTSAGGALAALGTCSAASNINQVRPAAAVILTNTGTNTGVCVNLTAVDVVSGINVSASIRVNDTLGALVPNCTIYQTALEGMTNYDTLTTNAWGVASPLVLLSSCTEGFVWEGVATADCPGGRGGQAGMSVSPQTAGTAYHIQIGSSAFGSCTQTITAKYENGSLMGGASVTLISSRGSIGTKVTDPATAIASFFNVTCERFQILASKISEGYQNQYLPSPSTWYDAGGQQSITAILTKSGLLPADMTVVVNSTNVGAETMTSYLARLYSCDEQAQCSHSRKGECDRLGSLSYSLDAAGNVDAAHLYPAKPALCAELTAPNGERKYAVKPDISCTVSGGCVSPQVFSFDIGGGGEALVQVCMSFEDYNGTFVAGNLTVDSDDRRTRILTRTAVAAPYCLNLTVRQTTKLDVDYSARCYDPQVGYGLTLLPGEPSRTVHIGLTRSQGCAGAADLVTVSGFIFVDGVAEDSAFWLECGSGTDRSIVSSSVGAYSFNVLKGTSCTHRAPGGLELIWPLGAWTYRANRSENVTLKKPGNYTLGRRDVTVSFQDCEDPGRTVSAGRCTAVSPGQGNVVCSQSPSCVLVGLKTDASWTVTCSAGKYSDAYSYVNQDTGSVLSVCLYPTESSEGICALTGRFQVRNGTAGAYYVPSGGGTIVLKSASGAEMHRWENAQNYDMRVPCDQDFILEGGYGAFGSSRVVRSAQLGENVFHVQTDIGVMSYAETADDIIAWTWALAPLLKLGIFITVISLIFLAFEGVGGGEKPWKKWNQ